MTSIQASARTKPSDCFTSARTRAEIDSRLQDLAQPLLREGPETPTNLEVAKAPAVAIDLNMLLAIPVSRLMQQPKPVATLANICQLLIKRGDFWSLKLTQGLAHKIYSLTRARHVANQLFYLYKGIAEIGMGLRDLGIKNVNIGLRENPAFVLHPGDQCLGHWALMSSAVLSREIYRAMQLAEKWRLAAADGHLESEIYRAGLALQIFHLLLGDERRCSKDIDPLLDRAPKEWRKAAEVLRDWTAALKTGTPAKPAVDVEPYPLFLGLDWYKAKPPTIEEIAQGDFDALCRVRRDRCDRKSAENLSVEQLVGYAELAARWELPQFLREIETVLKRCDPERYLQFSVGRVLGRSAVESLTCACDSQSTEVVTRDQVIVWLMDVRGYITLSEHWAAEQNFTLLSPLFKIVHEELEKIGGLLLEFAGDCVIIAFNTSYAPAARIQEVLFHTARCFQRLRTLNALSLPAGAPEVKVGIGLDQGPVAIGFLGGLRRCHLSILGSTVNRASRIEGKTKTLGRFVLVSARCFDAREPEVWKEPQMVNYSVRQAGRHKMRHVTKPVQLFAIGPLVPYWVDFVPMGFVAAPEPGIVYIDTGNSGQVGIIDHHFQGERADSACELLMRQPELLLDHLQGVLGLQIEFRLHQQPDMDCAATLYAAFELLQKQPRRPLLEKLAQYVSKIDQGMVPDPEHLPDSLYGVFIAHQTLIEIQHGKSLTDLMLLEAQMRVIDAALYLMEKHRYTGDLSHIFRFKPDWFADERRLIKEDHELYREDIRWRSQTYKACVRGRPKPIEGLWLDHPQSRIFKLWARNDPQALGGRGYPFLVVDWSQPAKNRFVISVDPESGTDLQGLGELLEAAEEKKRQSLGMERPVEPRRYPTNNSDPWYFGWGHGYTIIDSPREGTVLAAEEVRRIHNGWRP